MIVGSTLNWKGRPWFWRLEIHSSYKALTLKVTSLPPYLAPTIFPLITLESGVVSCVVPVGTRGTNSLKPILAWPDPPLSAFPCLGIGSAFPNHSGAMSLSKILVGLGGSAGAGWTVPRLDLSDSLP